MTLKSDDNCLTFIVSTFHSIGLESKGGSIVSHKLAYELARRGNYVYVFNEPLYLHKNINVIPTKKIEKDGGWWGEYIFDSFNYNINRTVSIYTQITWANPFNTKHNTRWILHHYDPDKWETFGPDDYICNFGDFSVPENTIQTKLTTFDYKLDSFYNKNNSDRKGFAHIIHKNTPEWGTDFLKNFGSVEIPHYNGKKELNYLLDEFNKYEYLLTFDDKTYYTTLAALCGTKSIILNPSKDITPLEYKLKNPTQMCGIAYGINDISWAEKTIDLVRYNLLELEKQDNKTIDEFINYWKNKLL